MNAVFLLLLFAPLAVAQAPASRKATKAELHQRAVTMERALNLAAFKKRYLPDREALFARHAGQWVVIASGKILPVRRETGGHFEGWYMQPAKTLEQAVAAANKMVPDAKHRFVFRIGEEGDRSYDLGMSARRNVLGGGFMSILPGDAMLTNREVVTIWGGKKLALKLKQGGGFVLPLKIKPAVDATNTVKATAAEFGVSTVLTGPGTVSKDLARALRLEQWEIPGTVKMAGTLQKGELRRARVALTFAGTKYRMVMPVAVWTR